MCTYEPIGLAIPASNRVVEDEAGIIRNEWTDSGSAPRFLFERIPFATRFADSPQKYLEEISSNSAEAIGTLSQRDVRLVGLCCTSSAALHPLDRTVGGEIRVLTPGDAIISVLGRIHASTVFLVTPYPDSIGNAVSRMLELGGVRVVQECHLGMLRHSEYDRVDLVQAALEMRRERRADAVVLSCTNVATLRPWSRLSNRAETPVVSSNSAILGELIRLAGDPTAQDDTLGTLAGLSERLRHLDGG